jgi:cytochrome oxidase assembly protein ShyY1
MSRPSLAWHINWPLTLTALALMPVLVSLGFWQLQRAEEKAVQQQLFEQRRSAPPVALQSVEEGAVDYTRVQVRGCFDNGRTFLLDNRVQNGRVGFEVISPLQTDAQAPLLLVNRGWIAGDPSRRQLPAIPAVEGEVMLVGHLYHDSAGFQLAEESDEKRWPRLLQGVQFETMAQLLDGAVFPFTLRLDPGQRGALQPEWVQVNMKPEQHVGYAVQWFGLAVTLAVAWLLASSNLWRWLRGGAAR